MLKKNKSSKLYDSTKLKNGNIQVPTLTNLSSSRPSGLTKKVNVAKFVKICSHRSELLIAYLLAINLLIKNILFVILVIICCAVKKWDLIW